MLTALLISTLGTNPVLLPLHTTPTQDALILERAALDPPGEGWKHGAIFGPVGMAAGLTLGALSTVGLIQSYQSSSWAAGLVALVQMAGIFVGGAGTVVGAVFTGLSLHKLKQRDRIVERREQIDRELGE